MIAQAGLWLISAYAVLAAIGIAVAVCVFVTPLMLRALIGTMMVVMPVALFLTAWTITWLIAFTVSIFLVGRFVEISIPLLFADLFVVAPLISYFGVRRGMKRLGERIARRKTAR